MNKRVRWCTVAAAVGLAVAGCGGGKHPGAPSGSSPPPTGNTSPTDFESFVQQAVQQPAAFGVAPVGTDALTQDQGLGDAKAFAGVTFPVGDALPAGTYQGATACTQAGASACSPGTSADLNSTLD